MVNVADWSVTPNLNVTVDGINIAEGCPAGNVNAMGRAIMAGVRSMYNGLPNLSNYVLINGSTPFTGQPTFQGRGGFIHNASSSLASGRRFVTTVGAGSPSGAADGDEWIEYS